MVNPKLGVAPSVFICGADARAKQEATDTLTQFGVSRCPSGRSAAVGADLG
jgi:hypothetical protein